MRERKGEKLLILSGNICLISRDDKQHTARDDSVDIHIFNSLRNKNNYTSLFQELYDIERNQTFRNAQHTYSTESFVLHDWTQLLPFQCYHFWDKIGICSERLHTFLSSNINVNAIKIHFQ